MTPAHSFLHVANGTSTTTTIEAAGIPGVCSIWADPLYEGPVPAGLSDDELVEVRRQFLAGSLESPGMASAGNDATRDPANDLRQWRAAIARHASYDEIVLWFEHDLFDQLNLIQLLTWIHERLPADKPISLICIGSFPGRPDFKGLGELTAEELAPLLDTRLPVTGPQYELALHAWRAFRGPTPEALDDLRRSDTTALPFLGAAITRFLQEYPWTTDGLSRSERRLLDLASAEGIVLWKALPRMHEGERSYFMGDTTLATLAETLSTASPPLLVLDAPGGEERQILRGIVALTDTGRAVRTGRLDRIAACGFDRWLGGVHLRSGDRLWRWDEARQRLAAS